MDVYKEKAVSLNNLIKGKSDEEIINIIKKEMVKIDADAFSRGVKVQIGEFTNAPVPKVNYKDKEQFKYALKKSIQGAVKDFEKAHGKIVFKDPRLRASLLKRIAGQALCIFERRMNNVS